MTIKTETDVWNVAKKATAAGFLIGVGCAANATVGGIMGATLFSTALVLIAITNLPLFTGRVGFAVSEPNAAETGLALGFNFIGVMFAAMLFVASATPGGFALAVERASGAAKCATPIGAFLAQAFFCGVLVHMAIKSYRAKQSVAPVVMCVVAFVLCGFEHCVADAFTLSVTETELPTAVSRIATAVVGNSLGALFIETLTQTERKRFQ